MNTTLLFFEQTFLNIPIDSFVLMRIRQVFKWYFRIDFLLVDPIATVARGRHLVNITLKIALSFQFAPGGNVVSKVRITQISNNIDQSNIAFYAFVSLLAYTALQIYRLPKLFIAKNSWFKRLSLTVLLALDLTFIIMFILRYFRLQQARMSKSRG